MKEKKEQNLAQLGNRLRHIRTVMSMTQKEVAEKTGMPTISINRLENGGSVSVHKLMTALSFYSRYVSIDALFDDKAWELMKDDREMLVKKTHINSIIEAKLVLMKDALIKEIKSAQQEQTDRYEELILYMRRGMNSAIQLLEDD